VLGGLLGIIGLEDDRGLQAAVAQVAVDAALAYLDYPRYSADWLAFRSEYALQLLNLSDGSWRTLDNAANTPPVWSPAGVMGEANCPT